jgi:hypothetical protein
MIAFRIGARVALAAALIATTGATLGAMPLDGSRAAAERTTDGATALRGVFRVVLEEEGSVPVPATIVLEERAGQLAASLLIDERVSLMRSVETDGGTLSAVVNTSNGLAKLTIRVTGNTVDGTVTAKKHAWKISGERSA